MQSKSEKFIYGKEGKTLDFTVVDKCLSDALLAEERLEIVQQTISSRRNKDRFAIPQDSNTSSLL